MLKYCGVYEICQNSGSSHEVKCGIDILETQNIKQENLLYRTGEPSVGISQARCCKYLMHSHKRLTNLNS